MVSFTAQSLSKSTLKPMDKNEIKKTEGSPCLWGNNCIPSSIYWSVFSRPVTDTVANKDVTQAELHFTTKEYLQELPSN